MQGFEGRGRSRWEYTGNEIPSDGRGSEVAERFLHRVAHYVGLEVAVDFGDGGGGVPEDFLNHAKRNARGGEPRAAGVPQAVEVQLFLVLQVGLSHEELEPLGDAIGLNGGAGAIGEDRPAGRLSFAFRLLVAPPENL